MATAQVLSDTALPLRKCDYCTELFPTKSKARVWYHDKQCERAAKVSRKEARKAVAAIRREEKKRAKAQRSAGLSCNFTTNLQQLQATALELWEKDKVSALELGRALRAVRDEMKAFKRRGAFKEWFLSKGLKEDRVYYCLRLADDHNVYPQPGPDTSAPPSKPTQPGPPDIGKRVAVPYAAELAALAQAEGIPGYTLLTNIVGDYVKAHSSTLADIWATESQPPFVAAA